MNEKAETLSAPMDAPSGLDLNPRPPRSVRVSKRAAGTLMLSVIDILGSYSVSTKEHFQVLRQPCFGLDLTTEQVKEIEHWYRNLLAHNGFITLGAVMRPDESGDPFVLDENGQPTTVRVKSLFQAVKLAWSRFDRNQIEPKRHVKQKHLIAKPVDLTASPASEIVASSGAYIDPKRFIRNM